MIKLIATDVDGTLLDNDSRLSTINRNAVLECQKRNIGVILATGKTIDSVMHLLRSLGLKLPQITMNGAITFGSDLKISESIKISPENYFKVIDIIKKRGYTPLIALEDGRILYDEYHQDMKGLEKIGEKLEKIPKVETEYFAKNTVDINIPILESDPLDKYLRDRFSGVLQFIRSGKYFFDILHLDATKGNALEKVSKKLNIKKEEIMAFGDSPNDLSMFDAAGTSVAVENSYPEVKKKAEIITDKNYDSGFGKAVYKYILKQS